MSIYLSQFRTQVPQLQGRQVLALLNKKRDSGEIQSVEEFKAQLNLLTDTLISETIIPSLKVFFGKDSEVIDSETYNFMLDRIRDDLDVGFTEVNTIEEVLFAHQNIVNEVVLTTIQFGINELEERISLHEFINSNKLGLDRGQRVSFKTSKSVSTPRGTGISSVLYVGTSIGDDAIIDTIGERLTLGTVTGANLNVSSVRQIFDSTTTASELDVEIPDSNILNLIDGQPGTYWIYNSLVSSPRANGVLQKIELDLAATQDINSIEIQPASLHPITIEKISFIGNDGIETDIGVPSRTISSPAKINFARVTANKLIVHTRQTSYLEEQFEEKAINQNFYDVLTGDSTGNPINLDSISEDLRTILTSNFLLEGIVGIPRNRQLAASSKFYQYIIGFDNIRVNFANYNDDSIFVGKSLEVDSPGQVALVVSETRAGSLAGVFSIDIDTFDEDKFYHGSLEYVIVKENFDFAGNFIGVDRFPILPISQQRVIHERLFLTDKVDGATKDNAGFFRFFPDLTGTVKVYRNGTLLIEGSSNDWVVNRPPVITSAGLDLLDQVSPSVVNAMKKSIKINVPVVSDIFTITYSPLVGNSLELPKTTSSLINVVSLGDVGRIRMCRENLVVTDRFRGANIITKSNIYLVTRLRRNSAELHLTPTLEEYALYAGTEDESKFVSDFF